MKRLVCILLSFCSALTACNKVDPSAHELWGKRLVRPRLTGAEWKRCCGRPEIRQRCEEEIKSREKALELLVIAGGDCLDKVVNAAAPEDRAAAYLIRAERNDDPVDLLRALQTAKGFNRALALQRLGLTKEAVRSWDEVVKTGAEWPEEARAFRDGLLKPEVPVAVLRDDGAPDSLEERFRNATVRFKTDQEETLRILDELVPLAQRYPLLAFWVHSLRANTLEFQGRYFEAYPDYERALHFANGDPTLTAAALSRRSENYTVVGDSGKALHDSVKVLELLRAVEDLNTRHQAYGSAAMAAQQLGYPKIALDYQNAAVSASGGDKTNLAIALRKRAEIHLALNDETAAENDFKKSVELTADMDPESRDLMRMRLSEIRGQMLLKNEPGAAIQAFTSAMELAKSSDSTYQAVLYFKRAGARRAANDPEADTDAATALAILRKEAKGLLNSAKRAQYENLWAAYFSRFQEMQQLLIKSRVDADDDEGAFLVAEQSRAFDTMQILLQSRSVPFHPIETKADLREQLARLPEDTVILQYVVLPDRTYTWVLVRGGIELIEQRPGREQIKDWVKRTILPATEGGFLTVMKAAYAGLFRDPLSRKAAASKTRIVVVPDGPMHGLPFAGLYDTRRKQYLIERGSVAAAGSTSLYLYALERDRRFSSRSEPAVLLVGDPKLDKRAGFSQLAFAKEEVAELEERYYPNAETLTDTAATIDRFLAGAKKATIIHFAGHGVANPQQPWKSRLLLAPGPNDSGELTAETLMQQLSGLDRTRLVILGACSTAGGNPVGPQGLAPLVRPLVAANVPAIVGTLWDVNDATAKDLLVSLHCHHRHGDDVAVALQRAQRERLRDEEPAMWWASFQVVGYAASPYARPATPEETRIDQLCSENSLQRPDGLHPQ